MSRSLASSLPPALKKLIPQTTATQLSLQPRNLYETLSRLPKDGVGSRVYQTRWQSKKIGGSYYEVTRVSLKDEGKHGKAWGRLVWKGRPVNEEERIRGALKYRWDVGISRGIGMKASAPAELKSTSPSLKSASSPSNPSSPKVSKRPETRNTLPGTSDKKPVKQTT
ncbi:hypothetical protein SCHPADRAFT_849098 [Schizopora paradoxa]|uniref:Uncharacterized protein n=1 Tax=Schizopora paradoxa TaxID=27342 RepID=A0A0H2RVT9_9AGAM|nr:hypothetical protein SCHPADRAFT_849098 [Schizopora paradoxa]